MIPTPKRYPRDLKLGVRIDLDISYNNKQNIIKIDESRNTPRYNLIGITYT